MARTSSKTGREKREPAPAADLDPSSVARPVLPPVLRSSESEGGRATEDMLEEDLGHLPPGMREKVAGSRARGLTMREWVYDLHVRQGRSMSEVGRILGLSSAGAHHHWNKLKEKIAAHAPRSPEDFEVLRERICAMLWQTVETTFPSSFALRASKDREIDVGDAVAMPAPSAPMLAIRLKALEQIARLYDVGMCQESRAVGLAPLPYLSPEEVGAIARERMLELHGKAAEIEDGRWEMG